MVKIGGGLLAYKNQYSAAGKQTADKGHVSQTHETVFLGRQECPQRI
jgi:hypothetical protein